MRIVFFRPLGGIEPQRGEVVYDGKTYLVVKHGLGMETVLNKNDNGQVIRSSMPEYWLAVAELERKTIEVKRAELNWHEQRVLAFEHMAKRSNSESP